MTIKSLYYIFENKNNFISINLNKPTRYNRDQMLHVVLLAGLD